MTNLKFFQCRSDRRDEKGNRYRDFFIAYEHNGKSYLVRVKPCFAHDTKLLAASATPIESPDNYMKYM